MAKTAFYSHPICQEHEAGPGHPEQPARLKAILEALNAPEFADLNRQSAPVSDIAALKEVHDADLVDLIFAKMPRTGYAAIDGDTLMSSASGEAARSSKWRLVSGAASLGTFSSWGSSMTPPQSGSR